MSAEQSSTESQPFNIVITSAADAPYEVTSNPNKYHVVSIRDNDWKAPVDFVADKCRSILPLRFSDVDDEIILFRQNSRWVLPEKKHVQQVLDFAKGKHSFLVHCHAGISRSSAMAYLIACTHMSALDALGILTPGAHHPNRRIVRLGAELLGRPEINEAIQRWYELLEDRFGQNLCN